MYKIIDEPPHLPMKILLLNQTYYPDKVATAQQLTDLAKYLTQQGCEVSVVTSQRDYAEPGKLHSKYEQIDGVHVHRVKGTGFGKKTFFHRIIDGVSFEAALVARLASLDKQDVVVSFTSPPLVGLFGLLFSKIWRARSVQWLMDINPDIAIAVGYLKQGSISTKLLTYFLELCLRHSDAIVVLDRFMKLRAVEHGAASKSVHIIPPWAVNKVEEPETIVKPEENSFRKEYKLTKKFIIQYSGNHSIVHPLDSILKLALELNQVEDIHFVFMGGGLRFQEVEKFQKEHKLNNILKLSYQPREKLNDALAMADLHVVIMGEDVNGLVHVSKIYGVLATGKPYVVIGPKNSHLGDLLRECPFGYQVEQGDVQGLRTVIEKIQDMSEQKLMAVRRGNLSYLAQVFGSERSMALFATEVLKISLSAVSHSVSPDLIPHKRFAQ